MNPSLEELEEEGTKRSVDVRGLLLSLKNALFIVTVFITYLLFDEIKILPNQLKYKTPLEFIEVVFLLTLFVD